MKQGGRQTGGRPRQLRAKDVMHTQCKWETCFMVTNTHIPFAHTHTHTGTHNPSVHTHVHTLSVHTHTPVHPICSHTCMHVLSCPHTHTRTHMHIPSIHTCTHTNILPTHTHTHTGAHPIRSNTHMLGGSAACPVCTRKHPHTNSHAQTPCIVYKAHCVSPSAYGSWCCTRHWVAKLAGHVYTTAVPLH